MQINATLEENNVFSAFYVISKSSENTMKLIYNNYFLTGKKLLRHCYYSSNLKYYPSQSMCS